MDWIGIAAPLIAVAGLYWRMTVTFATKAELRDVKSELREDVKVLRDDIREIRQLLVSHITEHNKQA